MILSKKVDTILTIYEKYCEKRFEDKFCISIKLLLSNVKTCSNRKLGKIIARLVKLTRTPCAKI